MTIRVAINGFGRIGRGVLRAAAGRTPRSSGSRSTTWPTRPPWHTCSPTTRCTGRTPARWSRCRASCVSTAPRSALLQEADPALLPWDELDVDVVIESTGRFRTRDEAAAHLRAGARKVIVSAPVKEADATLVLGVNMDSYDPDPPRHLERVLHHQLPGPGGEDRSRLVGIRHGLMTTIHAYTADQRLLDMPHKDLRRARAAALNLVPTTTGAAKAIGLVIPELQGKLHGFAVRVPTPTGSIVDLTVETERATSADEINAAFREHAEGSMAGILRYSEGPLVSSDIVRSPYSSIVDAPLTASSTAPS